MTRVGLVLGAGGIAGHGFHVGVLKALAEVTGWDPRTAEVVVGTSAGSQVGAYLRAGLGATDLFAHAVLEPLSEEGDTTAGFIGPPWTGPLPQGSSLLFRPPASPSFLVRAALRPRRARSGTLLSAALPRGRVPTEFIANSLQRVFRDGWPRRTFWVNAVRLSTGERVVFGRPGAPEVPVATAVAASCAIPAYFRPVDIAGHRYVDGGAWSHTNADLCAGLGLDLVVVVAPMSLSRRALTSPAIDLPTRAWLRRAVADEARAIRAGGTPVIAFQPTSRDLRTMGINAMNPSRRRPVAAQAYASTLDRLARPDVADRIDLLRVPGQPATPVHTALSR